MKAEKLTYIPGSGPAREYPLDRFLPIIPEGMVGSILDKNIPRGGLLLDPFGASPAAVLGAAKAGYRVIVACNNPITAHMMRVLAGGYSRERYSFVLSTLATSRKGDERLERHLNDLYQMQCPECGAINPASAFTWTKGGPSPVSGLINCPACLHRSDAAVSEEHLNNLSTVTKSGMHRARALERIAGVNDPLRLKVEQALDSYLPRPLYVIFTILNRIESLELKEEDRSILEALLISGLDSGNTLWPHPQGNPRPRQLGQAAQIHENNIWMAMSDSIDAWCGEPDPIPFVEYPQSPDKGGITIFRGKFRDLAKNFGGKVPVDGVLAVLPRPNQAFWTLSAIWAGWLWGQAAVQPFRSALIRQRYDWQWYADALASITSALIRSIHEKVPIIGLLNEYEPSFLISSLAAFDSAGYGLAGYALQMESNVGQILWQADQSGSSTATGLRPSVRKAITDLLEDMGQPVEYNLLAAAAGIRLAERKQYRSQIGESSDRYMAASNTIKSELVAAGDYIRYRGQRTIESEIWWRREIKAIHESLDDRVELAVLEDLRDNEAIDYFTLRERILARFQGLSIPSDEVIRTILDSYGEISEGMNGTWKRAGRENPISRHSDLIDIISIIKGTGIKFGYRVEGDQEILWIGADGELLYRFIPITHACVSILMADNKHAPDKSLIVIPASRANLLLYKIEKNPLLYECMAAGWRIVKFRHIRQISLEHDNDPDQWSSQLEMDPVEFKPIQMKMF